MFIWIQTTEDIQGSYSEVIITAPMPLTSGTKLGPYEIQSPPRYEVAVQGTPRNLHPILRDEVYRIAAEAMRNAFRHAQAGQIEVEIHYDDREFGLHVRDDGKGMDPSVLGGDGREGHFGLHSMRERAKLVGGELAIWSEVDSGSEMVLSIPASNAYAKTRRSSWLSQKLVGR